MLDDTANKIRGGYGRAEFGGDAIGGIWKETDIKKKKNTLNNGWSRHDPEHVILNGRGRGDIWGGRDLELLKNVRNHSSQRQPLLRTVSIPKGREGEKRGGGIQAAIQTGRGTLGRRGGPMHPRISESLS